MATRLHGVIPPLVTPMDRHGELDRAALHRLMDHVFNGGVHGVFLLGTTGEAPSLHGHAKRALMREGAALARGRGQVLAGISACSLDETVALAMVAADAGVDCAVLTAPYYYRISQAELLDWCQRIIDVSPLPVLLYNMPGNTQVAFETDLLRRLASHPRVVGLKDSSGDFECLRRFQEIAERERPDWSILTGPDEFTVDLMQIGGAGCTSGGAMLFPEAWRRVFDDAADGRWNQARRLQDRLVRCVQAVYETTPGDGAVPKTLKAALSSLGICGAHVAPPLQACGTTTRERIADLVRMANTDDRIAL